MTWYLVANTPEGFRTFRVSRIDKATILDLPAQRPHGFDLAAYWKSSTEKFRESRRRYKIIIRLEPRAAEDFVIWRRAKRVDVPDADGWVTLNAEFDDEEHACFMVQGLGPRAEVIEPQSLRERVLAAAEALLARMRR